MVILKDIYCKYILVILTMFLFSGCVALMPKAKPDYTVEVADMDFVFVKGAHFSMGDTTTNSRDSIPVHDVILKDFAASMYEVTFAQYDQFCKETNRALPSDEGWGRDKRPVINVSWDDALAYSKWLSNKTHLSFSLPSEAQWEFLARAGTKTRYWTGDKMPKNSANCGNCGSQWDRRMTAPSGTFAPNPWGLYDTAGNVSEWTLDDYNGNYVNAPTDGSAWLNDKPGRKIYRGGSWKYPASRIGSGKRDWRNGSEITNDTGFRLVINNFVLPKK